MQCACEMTWAFAWRDSGSRDEFSSFVCMEMWWEEIKKIRKKKSLCGLLCSRFYVVMEMHSCKELSSTYIYILNWQDGLIVGSFEHFWVSLLFLSKPSFHPPMTALVSFCVPPQRICSSPVPTPVSVSAKISSHQSFDPNVNLAPSSTNLAKTIQIIPKLGS